MSVVQKILLQAKKTFVRAGSDPGFMHELEALKDMMCTLTPEDFKVTPELADKTWNYPPFVTDSPSCCMEVYECPDFSVGIFLLKPKKCMPLHDHPGMYGVMKVLFGSMMVTSYNKPVNLARLQPPYLCKYVKTIRMTATSEPCSVQPENGNIHEIRAQDEPVAFLDILAPPYDPSKGRDCVYYTRESPPESPPESISAPSMTINSSDIDKSEWLRPGSNPPWFSCVPIDYTGPKVS